MSKHTKRPSELRSLVGAVYGVFALVMAGLLNKLNEVLCSLVSFRSTIHVCAPVSEDVIHLLYWAAVAGCVFSCYRAYRDFYVGDYYADLVSRDHRW